MVTLKKPLVSIIIVNFNGKKWLQNCLSSLTNQTYRNFEIILIDNNSTDRSDTFIKNKFPKVQLVKLAQNVGFAGGNNEGYKKAKGEYILLLNNDTTVEKNFIENFLKAFGNIPNLGIAQSKIVLMDKNQLDTCGGFWTSTSFLYYYGNSKDPELPQYNKVFPVFSCKGASVLIKRDVIEKIGLFDEKFWNYYEETDFCHRVWVSGYECWYWPKAVCHHAMGGTSLTFKNEFIQFHNFKNKLCSYLKNLSFMELVKTLPIFLILNLAIGLIWVVQGKWRYTIALFQAVGWNILNIANTLKKRSEIQRNRKVPDQVLWKKIKRNPSFDYYTYLFRDDLSNFKDSMHI
jgi:GT2 family glycosyltransferase